MRCRDDRGQALLLAPIALLIVIALGAVTLEVAALHLKQRQLDDLADSLANDAATVGFDVDAFRATGEIVIDTGRATSVIAPGIAISNVQTATASGLSITPGPNPEATIDLEYEYEYVLGRALFGLSTTLTATGEAALVRSDD